MKKPVKIIIGAVVCIAFAAGGYFAGQNTQISSILSAMPKKTTAENNKPHNALPIESAAPAEADVQPVRDISDEPPAEAADRTIAKSGFSAVDDTWSVVSSSTVSSTGETFTLYTSAEKDGDEFIWDDSQKWVLEIYDNDGGYYTLYDQLVTNGSVYFEVAERENGEEIAYVYTVTGAGVSVMQYTKTENGFTEKNIYNSGSLNKVFSSVPQYE